MASATKQTKRRRKNKEAARGQARKKKIRSKGSTPKFPIHVGSGN